MFLVTFGTRMLLLGIGLRWLSFTGKRWAIEFVPYLYFVRAWLIGSYGSMLLMGCTPPSLITRG